MITRHLPLQVCNHPDLFERRDVKSPIVVSAEELSIPRLMYHGLVADFQRLNRQELGRERRCV